MERPIVEINTRVCYTNDISNIFSIVYKCFKMAPKIWSKLGVDELLNLLMVLINSALENSGHSACWYNNNLSRSWKLISLS